MSQAILNDITRCIGCGSCELACSEANDLPRRRGARELSATTWTCVEQRGDTYVRRQCLHCLDPACVSVCPVGALRKTAEGPVVYHEEKCIGCRYCMVACPFDVPKYEWDALVPRVRKCIMCFERYVSKGEQPACTRVCPTEATIFGERDELLATARRRLAQHPKRYVSHIYGEHEAGGTGVLYLAPVSFASLGFHVGLRNHPYPQLTWDVLSKLPQVVSVAGVGLLGIWWIIRRRQQIAQEQAQAAGEQPYESTDDSQHAGDPPDVGAEKHR